MCLAFLCLFLVIGKLFCLLLIRLIWLFEPYKTYNTTANKQLLVMFKHSALNLSKFEIKSTNVEKGEKKLVLNDPQAHTHMTFLPHYLRK